MNWLPLILVKLMTSKTNKVQIQMPPKLIPVFGGVSRYRGAYGGRGSGKTRTFALMTAIRGYQLAQAGKKGAILCGREFMNTLADSSMEEIKQAILSMPFLAKYYDIGEKYIRTKNRRIHYLFTGLRYNLDSLKSKARIHLTWVDEAENVSDLAWSKLLPTVREHDSEVWITWNPERDGSATDVRFRKHFNPKIVEINYDDNPFFPDVLEQERLADKERLDRARYEWIWEGKYLQITDANVFSNFEIADFDIERHWTMYFGLDFGFAKDPTAGVKCYIGDNTLYISHEAVAVGLEIDETADFLIKKLPDVQNYPLTADGARPESISYLKRHGLPKVRACVKGAGSVEDGISHIKSFDKVVIHPRCKHTMGEFKSYRYKVDRLTGEVLPVLMDENNHTIDAIRYALEQVMKGRKSLQPTTVGVRKFR